MADPASPGGRCECGEVRLVPEASVPLAGFSKELRLAADAERYRFPFALRGEIPFPVHIVFSPSERRAEIKAGDLKAYRVSGVASPCEAQRRWIVWWRTGRVTRTFAAPRRAGRFPGMAPSSS